MKVLVSYIDDNHITATALICDSAITRCKDPFFVPDGREWQALVLRGVVIDRLGKGISSRFADRYYSQCLSAAHPFATNIPDQYAYRWGRDGALIVSQPSDASQIVSDKRELLNNLIAEYSSSMTLKTGDMILMAEPGSILIEPKSYNIDIPPSNGFPRFTLKIR